MTRLFSLLSVALVAVSASAIALQHRQDDNNGIRLAVSPKCGRLGGNFTDVNAGIDMSTIKTIVSFGDSYTDGGIRNGSKLRPPVISPPNPLAGGRGTNGPVWIENIANDMGANFMDYAVSGGVVNVSLWPSAAGKVDFIQQAATFLNQSNKLDPATTLYTVFFGINDFGHTKTDGNHLPEAAADLLKQISLLASPPTNARSFLVADIYGRGNHAARGEAWKQQIFAGLGTMHTEAPSLNVAYADFSTIWDAVRGTSPGFAAFGYTSSGSCLATGVTTTEQACADPEHTFYWLSGHPSKETHRIMADYVKEVLATCAAP
ncbi:carbohydrate esterase family 16 protein [Amylostereum chailletii]|nr:carbohydrate esterase family 16 protein [Amylostereum chailletii]